MAAAECSHGIETVRKYGSLVLTIEKPLRSCYTGPWLRDTVLAQATRSHLPARVSRGRAPALCRGDQVVWSLRHDEKALIERRVNRLRHLLLRHLWTSTRVAPSRRVASLAPRTQSIV